MYYTIIVWEPKHKEIFSNGPYNKIILIWKDDTHAPTSAHVYHFWIQLFSTVIHMRWRRRMCITLEFIWNPKLIHMRWCIKMLVKFLYDTHALPYWSDWMSGAASRTGQDRWSEFNRVRYRDLVGLEVGLEYIFCRNWRVRICHGTLKPTMVLMTFLKHRIHYNISTNSNTYTFC